MNYAPYGRNTWSSILAHFTDQKRLWQEWFFNASLGNCYFLLLMFCQDPCFSWLIMHGCVNTLPCKHVGSFSSFRKFLYWPNLCHPIVIVMSISALISICDVHSLPNWLLQESCQFVTNINHNSDSCIGFLPTTLAFPHHCIRSLFFPCSLSLHF